MQATVEQEKSQQEKSHGTLFKNLSSKKRTEFQAVRQFKH
jgi:hypothetical protein